MPRRLVAALSAAVVLAALASCSSPTRGAATGGQVAVVASTNVWGDIAASVGGAHVHVTSIIDDPAKDPHEYQADARTQLAIAKAAVVIENGGGYDDFVPKMLAASKNPTKLVIDAVHLSGYTGGDVNEHVWYDYPTVEKVIDAIAASLNTADPAHRSDYTANAAKLTAQVQQLEATEASMSTKTAGVAAGITEPVPDYVLQALKMDIVTPAAFSKAVEDGTDVSASVLQETLDQYSSGRVKLLVYNVQTSGPQSDAVIAAAKKAGVPAVPVSETLPSGLDYVAWQQGVLAEIAKDLEL